MSLQLPENPYKTLGVERDATEAEIKQAYFALVRQHPPERDPEGFKRIRAAYEKLRSGGERAETDLFMVDDRDAERALENIQYLDAPPPAITAETIKSDLIEIEALSLLNEAVAGGKA
jgi:curved DNA-binding protein CbpA